MRYETLTLDVIDRVALVTINRPEIRKGPLAVRLAKLVVRAGMDADQHTGQVVERLAQAQLYTTEDKTEGAAAFLDKRTPTFRGK